MDYAAPGGMTLLSAGGGFEHVNLSISGLNNFIAKADRMKGDFSHTAQVFGHQVPFAVFQAQNDTEWDKQRLEFAEILLANLATPVPLL